jgi:hypothetical protein
MKFRGIMKTQRVVFRKFKKSGEIIAYFLDKVDGYMINSYMHIGQHGAASYPNSDTIPAKTAEYTPLLRELVNVVGYSNLRVVRRGRVNYE